MINRSAIMASVLLGAAVAATAEPVDFEGDAVGSPPKGWTVTMTGKGIPRWTVERDDTATHIPSSVWLILAATVPSLELALGLLLVRAALSQMDVPTRSSYVMAVVAPPERPAAASVTSVPRSLASAIGPAIAGALFAAGYTAWPLVICGLLKIAYDLALLWAFRHTKPPEESGQAGA